MNIQLSPSQEKAKSLIYDYLTDYSKKNKMFLLAGSAGTGKSTLISHILCKPEFQNKKIVFSATTNKAVSILQSMCHEKYDTEKMDIVYLTIHKLLKIKRKINRNGEELFQTDIDTESKKVTKAKSIFNYDIVVIDESSMISQDIMLNLEKIVYKMKGKIIFLGDKAQLPPVNETESIIFSSSIPKFELQEIMRYQGNLVLLANKFRKLVFSRDTKISFREYRDKTIKTYTQYDKWIANYLQEIEKLTQKNNLDNLLSKLPIFLVYTNRMCDRINQDVRKIIFPGSQVRYQEGEIILFNNYYYQKCSETEKSLSQSSDCSEDTKYYTSQKSQVKKVEVQEYQLDKLAESLKKDIPRLLTQFQVNASDNLNVNMLELEDLYLNKLEKTISEITELKVKHYILTLQDGKSIWVIHEDMERKMETIILNTREAIHKFKKYFLRKYSKVKEIKILLDKLMTTIWENFYGEVLDKFADISYGYSITTHKSQGSTFRSVYLHLPNIVKMNSNEEESYRCLYTAFTRSSKKVHLLVK